MSGEFKNNPESVGDIIRNTAEAVYDVDKDQNQETLEEAINFEVSSNNQVTNPLSFDPSSFDINMAEFPIAHLSQRLPRGIDKTQIRYSDYIKDFSGKLIKRNWTIMSNAKMDVKDDSGNVIGQELIGIGGPSSLQVFYEILQIWREQGFKSNKIFIGTYYNLLKRLGWPICGTSYKQLEKDLNSLYGLEFIAENAYYDKETNRLVDAKIKLFEGFSLFKVRETTNVQSDFGYISATQSFYESIKNKSSFYLPFDKEFFHCLTPHESKLALYLSKVFNPYRKKTVIKYYRNILDLCSILPIYSTSKQKQKYYLLKAAAGLVKKNFILLEDYYTEGDIIIFINRQQQSLLPFLKNNEGHKTKQNVDILVEDQLNICGDIHSKKFYEIVAKYVPDELIYKCLSEAKVEGKNKRKYYTYQIKLQAKEYLDPILKDDDNE